MQKSLKSSRQRRREVLETRELKNFIQFVLEEEAMPNRKTRRSFKRNKLIEVKDLRHSHKPQTLRLHESYVVNVLGIKSQLLAESKVNSKVNLLILKEHLLFQRFWSPLVNEGGLGDFLKNAFEKATEKGKTVVNSIWKPFSDFGTSIKTVTGALYLACTTEGGAAQLFQKFKNYAAKLYGKIKEWIKKGIEAAKKWFAKIKAGSVAALGKKGSVSDKLSAAGEAFSAAGEDEDKSKEKKKESRMREQEEGQAPENEDQALSPLQSVIEKCKEYVEKFFTGSGTSWKDAAKAIFGLVSIAYVAGLVKDTVIKFVEKLDKAEGPDDLTKGKPLDQEMAEKAVEKVDDLIGSVIGEATFIMMNRRNDSNLIFEDDTEDKSKEKKGTSLKSKVSTMLHSQLDDKAKEKNIELSDKDDTLVKKAYKIVKELLTKQVYETIIPGILKKLALKAATYASAAALGVGTAGTATIASLISGLVDAVGSSAFVTKILAAAIKGGESIEGNIEQAVETLEKGSEKDDKDSKDSKEKAEQNAESKNENYRRRIVSRFVNDKRIFQIAA